MGSFDHSMAGFDPVAVVVVAVAAVVVVSVLELPRGEMDPFPNLRLMASFHHPFAVPSHETAAAGSRPALKERSLVTYSTELMMPRDERTLCLVQSFGGVETNVVEMDTTRLPPKPPASNERLPRKKQPWPLETTVERVRPERENRIPINRD
jgi:hypothetical protein